MKRFSLAARHPAASEPRAAPSGAGETVDGRPTDTTRVANPSLAVGGDAGKKGQLTEPTIGLRPVAMAILFEPLQIQRGTDLMDAIGIAVGVHARQQVGAACAVRRPLNLRLSLARKRQTVTQ